MPPNHHPGPGNLQKASIQIRELARGKFTLSLSEYWEVPTILSAQAWAIYGAAERCHNGRWHKQTELASSIVGLERIDASIGSAHSAGLKLQLSTNSAPSQTQTQSHRNRNRTTTTTQQQQQQHGDDDDDEEDGRGDGVLALLSAPRVRDDAGGVAVLGVRETAHQHLQVQGLRAPGVLALCEEGDGEEEGLSSSSNSNSRNSSNGNSKNGNKPLRAAAESSRSCIGGGGHGGLEIAPRA
ncbi:hypothetical protein LTR56_005157 [Elasticomyces elasticus]|nr:hypothetical protein LTR56_005157 [Elasticomyces elasticus]KAK3659612.1 hypothetical protein LTR22_008343 [Elasticomyces elasticus]KAK5759673.1 hypothetical protein LTS12_010189 [Elasticomyces elasticus]